ncbi:MAG: tetratricopeptide repeat protein [Candidatus Sumerlaeaceae bacterium]
MDDMMDVVDQQGQPHKITRSQYSVQLMNAARQNWSNLDVLRQIGPQLLTDGFPKEALEVAEHACELSSGHVPDLYWRSAALAETGRLDEAAAAFEEIIEDAAYPHDIARATLGLAKVRARQNRIDETMVLLDTAVDTDPANPQLLLAVYGFYNERGEAARGMEKVMRFVEKRPHSPVGYRALAQIAASACEKDELKRRIHEALSRASTEEEKQDLLAELTFLLGQQSMPHEIIALVEPHIQQVHQPFALLNLAQALLDVGRVDHSRQLLEAIKHASPPEMHPMIDQRLGQLDQHEKPAAPA